jgi:pilus assembly protein CpaE
VLSGERAQKQFAGARQTSDRSWPAYHEMLARVAVLERAAVFFSLPEATLRNLARRVRQLAVAARGIILYQGDPGDTIFLIESGTVSMVVERPPGAVTVAVLGPGDFFGEAACMLNRPQQGHFIAQSDCRLVALDRQSLQAVVGRDTGFMDELRRLADQRYRTFADTAIQATWGMLLNEAQVVGLYSPKGGSGGTCLALNLVGALSQRHPGQVLLLDLDFPYSHAALLAGLVPTSCLARLAEIPAEGFEEALLSTVLYHSGGPMILPGALRPEESDEVTPELIVRAMTVLRKTFKYVVVDLGIAIDDATLAVFDLTQHVVLIASPELSAVKSAADALEILHKLGTPSDRLTVVLNNRTPKPAVLRPAVERMLKRNVDVEIAFDGSKPDQAALTGTILSMSDPRSEITRGARAVADIILEKQGGGGTNQLQVDTLRATAVAEDC